MGEGEFEKTLPDKNARFLFGLALVVRVDGWLLLPLELLLDLQDGVGVSSEGDSSKSSSSSISGNGDCWLRGRGELTIGPGGSV